jgi:hypothetical protein
MISKITHPVTANITEKEHKPQLEEHINTTQGEEVTICK